MDENTLKYIVARLVNYANEAHEEYSKDKGDAYKQGRNMAYYEMLDVLQAEIDAHDGNLKDYGLEGDLSEYM